jgi:GntR family transcriptional regulator
VKHRHRRAGTERDSHHNRAL